MRHSLASDGATGPKSRPGSELSRALTHHHHFDGLHENRQVKKQVVMFHVVQIVLQFSLASSMDEP